ncbi:MAG: myristoyl transferase [Chloroflexi bacterium]|nr:myristoyl transferase [Chloroflexota bacterium]|tara:strand:+ start:451 stop:1464 length:1014 start_codon:yes stop_codon:yes gene_type:complete
MKEMITNYLKVITIRLVAVVTLIIVSIGCMNGNDSNELRTTTLMLDWTPNTNHAGIYVALDQGWYKEMGIDLQIIEPAAAGVEPVLGQGKVDFGISYAEYMIPARLAEIPITSIATILPHNDSSLMSLSSTGIENPKDLVGKTYGGWGGPLEKSLIDTLVTCAGGDPNKVKYVEVGNIDYVPGMQQGRFDFVWVFEGWDVIRAKSMDGVEIKTLKFIDYTNCIPDWYTPLIASNDKLISENPDLITSFLDATNRGYEYAMSNPDEAATILLKSVPELDEQLVRKSTLYLATRYKDENSQWGYQELDIWEGFESFLLQSGITENSLEVENVYSNEFLP